MPNEIWKYLPTEIWPKLAFERLWGCRERIVFNPLLHLDSSKNMMRMEKVEHTQEHLLLARSGIAVLQIQVYWPWMSKVRQHRTKSKVLGLWYSNE